MLRSILAVTLLLFSASADARPRGTIGVNGSIVNVGGMSVNLTSGGFGQPFSQRLNWWKLGSEMRVVSTVNGQLDGIQIWNCPADCSTPTTYFSASTGELISPLPSDVTSFSRAFFDPVLWPQYQYEDTGFGAFAGQQWGVKWDGCASPSVSIWSVGSLGTGGTSSFGANSGTVTFGSSGYSNVGLTFTVTGIPACYSDPPRNIRVCMAGDKCTRLDAGEVFDPDWLAMAKPSTPLGFVRMMDWMQTNFGSFNELSQLADDNFNSINNSLNMAVGSGSITGSTLTISSFIRGTPFRAGQRVVCIGCTQTATITSQASGTPGGVGTYNLSGSSPASSTVVMGIIPAGANGGKGPKGGIHPTAACQVASALSANIEYPLPIAASNQFATDAATSLKACMPAGLLVKYSCGNENWNTGFNTYRYVQAYASVNANYSGYRCAELMEIVAGVYGTNSWHHANNPTSRWLGAIGSQLANTAVSTGNIQGAMDWITASPSPLTLPQLFYSLDVAPYWGAFYNGATVTGITAAASAVVTGDNNGAGGKIINDGQTVRMFVNGGTMAAALNNLDFTASATSLTGFTINANTTGLTYGGTLNGAVDSTLFKLADQSTALNISTPSTYPNKFSYFAQQYTKAILNGSATDASYGTITIGDALNLSTNTGSILDYFQRNALIAQTNSLELSQYEGGFGATLVGNAQGQMRPPQLAFEFLNNSQFFAGVVGDAINTPSNAYATAYSQFDSVNGVYPSQYTDTGNQSQFGPWGAVRFFPGDLTNPKWASVLAKNAAGRYVPPSPPSVWTATYPGASNFLTINSACSNPCTDTLNNAVIGTAATSIKVLITLGGGTVTSVTCDGVTISTPDVSTTTARTAAIFTIPVGAGTNLRNCSFVTASSQFQRREFYVITASGLTAPNVPIATASAGGPHTIAYTKQSLLLNVTACNTGTYSSTSGVSPASGIPTTTTVFSDTSANLAKMAAFQASFSAVKFSMQPGCNFGSVSAAYN